MKRLLAAGLLLCVAVGRAQAENLLEDVACASEDSLRSENSAMPAEVTFVNRSGRSVHTYWLNYEGKRVFYSELPPGKHCLQRTYVTHPWVITPGGCDNSGTWLYLFQPTEEHGIAVIR